MRRGVRIACDVGSVRIGIARSDASGILATPVEPIRAGDDAMARFVALAGEYEAIEVYVGLPRHLNGAEGSSAEMARSWARAVADALAIPVRLVDERLSTVQAQRSLSAGGSTTRESRSRIDSASAAIVLQSALDFESASGQPAGELVSEDT